MVKNNKFRIDLIDYSAGRIMGNKALLKPFTTFKVPGAQFSKQFKQKRWDGTVSVIKWNKLPVGLIPYTVNEAAKRGLILEFFLNNTKLTPRELEEGLFQGPKLKSDIFIEMVNLFPDNITGRYYQIDSLEAMLRSARGLLVLPTGSGKSLSLYMLTYVLRSILGTGLILVPRSALVSQLARDFMLFSSGTVEVLNSVDHGRELLSMLDDEEPNVVISTWQSWSRWMKDGIAIEPDYVIVDEAHTLAKKKLPWDYMKAFANTRFRYGLTATENEMIYERLALEGLLGPVMYSERPEQLIKEGFLAKPCIHRLFLDHNLGHHDGKAKISTRDLVRRPERFEVLSAFIDRMIPSTDSLLVLTDAVEAEINPFCDCLSGNLHDTDIFSLTRLAKKEEREAIIKIVDQPARRTVLVVTYGLFQMGINIPNLKHIMLFSPNKSSIRVLQSIGRGLRPKARCYVYDIIDFCAEKIDHMASKRMAIYKGAYGDELEIKDERLEV